MHELCLSGSSTSPQFSNLILSHFKLFFSFIHSHPIYFCYIIFFSPYILKLLSFLSPLLITTSLLLLSYLTICPQPKALKEKLSSNIDFDGDFYKIFFDASSLYQIENPDEDHENPSCEEPLEDFEDGPFYEDEKTIKLPNMDLDKFNLEKKFLKPRQKADSDEIKSKKSVFSDSPSSSTLDLSLSSDGSMRTEKEWTRTLGCKLFEEHQRGDGEEGMDLLWETYENDSNNKGKKMKSNLKKNKNKTKFDTEFCYEDDDDEDELATQQLCFLPALKFSTRKNNLGMERPNIAKVSKAIKGYRSLHNVTKHSKIGNTSNRLINFICCQGSCKRRSGTRS